MAGSVSIAKIVLYAASSRVGQRSGVNEHREDIALEMPVRHARSIGGIEGCAAHKDAVALEERSGAGHPIEKSSAARQQTDIDHARLEAGGDQRQPPLPRLIEEDIIAIVAMPDRTITGPADVKSRICVTCGAEIWIAARATTHHDVVVASLERGTHNREDGVGQPIEIWRTN